MTSSHQRYLAIRAMRDNMWSPGRISSALREDRARFWEAIVTGLSSEDASGEAGFSPAVGTRWFHVAGGMPPLDLTSVSSG